MENKFKFLTEELNKKFKEGINLINMKNILDKYNGNEWENYINESKKSYSKSLMYKNEYYEIYVICWLPNQKSLIHDHPNKGCLLKIFKGELVEEVYENKLQNLKLVKINNLKKGEISYQEGKTVLHKILNNSEKKNVLVFIYIVHQIIK